jgi:UDP-glucose 4-epimerase
VEKSLGRRVQIDRRPVRPGDVRHSQADNTRLRSLFPEVRPVPLAEGLAHTIGWMQAFLAVRAGAAV